MIYNDAAACDDLESCPADREEDCLNCGATWAEHCGWSCDGRYGNTRVFSDTPASNRYLTQSMKDSIAPKKSVKEILHNHLGPSTCATETTVDVSDWRAWAHNRPGDCPCGIARAQCVYHK